MVYSAVYISKVKIAKEGPSRLDLIAMIKLPYARHYKPRLVYFLPHFSLRFIFKSGYIADNLCTKKLYVFKKVKSGFKSRAGYNGECTVIKTRNQRGYKFVLREVHLASLSLVVIKLFKYMSTKTI